MVQTTNFDLEKPAQGTANWHTPINSNLDIIDAQMKDNADRICPTGSMLMYGASSAPAGWLLCDGSLVSRATYADLFAIIGTTFGAGDGSTTFKLPDLRDKFVVGAGTSYNNNDTGGEATHVLTVDEMPSHTHGNSAVVYSVGGASLNGNGGYTPTNIGSTGGGQAHNNLPPYIGLTFIIKT